MSPLIEEEVYSQMLSTLQTMKDAKPNDRSEKDRRYAVAITEMEKSIAYFAFYVMLPVTSHTE